MKELTISIVSALIGVSIGAYYQIWLMNDTKLSEHLMITSVAIILISTLVIISVSYAMKKILGRHKDEIERNISPHLHEISSLHSISNSVLTPEKSYEAVSEHIASAEKEILALTYVFHDPVGESTFLRKKKQIIGRRKFYDSLKVAIGRDDINYTRIFQFDPENLNRSYEIIRANRFFNSEEAALTEAIDRSPNINALHHISAISTTSMLIIDSKHIFMNIDLKNTKKDGVSTPANIFIRNVPKDAMEKIRTPILSAIRPAQMVTKSHNKLVDEDG